MAETPKVVRIQDRALGITSIALQVLAAWFVGASLLLGHKGYLNYEPVTGTIGGQLLGTVQVRSPQRIRRRPRDTDHD